jgi:hypothetical protein
MCEAEDKKARSAPLEEPAAPARPFQFSLGTLMLWVAGFAVVCSLLAWLGKSVQEAAEAARCSNCTGHLKYLGLALLNYHDTYGCFPPAYTCDEEGTPMHSWRVLILPFIEQRALYDQYDFSQPWNAPSNRRLASARCKRLFQCPSAGLEQTTLASYVAVVGPGAAWPGRESLQIAPWDPPEMFAEESLHTILLIEVADSDIDWMEPRDLTLDEALRGIEPESGLGISSHHPAGINYVSLVDQVDQLDRDTDATQLRALLLVEMKHTRILPADP